MPQRILHGVVFTGLFSVDLALAPFMASTDSRSYSLPAGQRVTVTPELGPVGRVDLQRATPVPDLIDLVWGVNSVGIATGYEDANCVPRVCMQR